MTAMIPLWETVKTATALEAMTATSLEAMTVEVQEHWSLGTVSDSWDSMRDQGWAWVS